jgi:hypothetical protein
MIAVGVVEMAADQVVDVTVVRNRLVPAALAVDVLGLVGFAVVVGSASLRVLGVDREDVLVDVVSVGVMEVAVVQVIDVVAVLHRRVSAAGRVPVLVMFVDLVIAHEQQCRPGAELCQAAKSETRSQISPCAR